MLCMQISSKSYRKKSKYFKQGVYCPKCFKIIQKQKNGFEERKKQIEIAKKNGAKHLGS